MENFTPEVSDKIQYYVYRLIDPRNGETFYIGKGKGNRLFSHVRGSVTSDSSDDAQRDEESEKIRTIKEILRADLDVIHVVHRHGMDEKTAHEVEAALIDLFPSATNKQGGSHSNDRGPMHASEIVKKYNLRETVRRTNDKLLLINVNVSSIEEAGESYLENVRLAWRISLSRASEATHILAVVQGVVRGVYVAKEWLPATKENFPEISHDMPGRAGFHGQEADEDTVNHYRDTRLPSDIQHNQNPIRYWYT
ncbi:hypothetical protein M0534_01390 [Methylonatrum kenyense]|uniref:LEM-3-like GIY-YIG domain-containing protein n=1 Tax=Methylonatrum kenyense TaxID=455253 RepID=UPI0020C04894|nr:hypothetical protein [Methylonatrum kenyense]MCK8514985.1 hypothetical protein [Methylonatrum kenyense]